MRRGRPFDVAIVGMACRFPGASDLFAYWENILGGVDATGEVPPDRWDPATFFDPAPASNDRVACRRGGYLDTPIPFDPASHGIMPNAVEGGEPEQFLVLDAARAALADAGLVGDIPDGRRVEVIIGRGNDLNRGNLTRLQHGRIVAQTAAILGSLHPEWSEADREAVRLDLKASLPPFEAATIPGQITNATAGRVANRLDLGGASYVVDAASASSLVALDLGARALAEGRADLALVGGVYLEADGDFPLVFQQIGALSMSGQSRPFAADADGLLSGEGVGMVVLKRLIDAERDGDRIYAVLKGLGVASGGRGRGLAAPGARGHARAIRRAYRSSGVDPSTVGLIEGHGLGVPVADRAELRALRATFPPIARGRRALGAVSSMIGHAMPAAGMAGLIKVALSLHHRVLPPTLHAERPHPLLDREDSPVTLNPRSRPWVHGDPTTPRRAGLNAFGFAGINAHAILEEHSPSADSPSSPGALLSWESEAILLSAPDRSGLIDRARGLLGWLRGGPVVTLKDLAFTLNTGEPVGPARLGLVAKSLDDLASRLEVALPRLADSACGSIRDARGLYYWDRSGAAPSKIAFLFPGEGSQYPGMLADLCPHFPEVRALFDTSDRIARESGAETWPSEHLFGSTTGQDPALWSAEVGVNVVLSSQWALYQLLTQLGLEPDAVVGHSSGELLALAASGAIEVDRDFEDRLGELGAIFGRLEGSGLLPVARLVAIAADRSRVEAATVDGLGRVEVAMDNCPHQVVVAGDPASVEDLVGRLRGQGVVCEDLPFARAYHTPGFAPALGPIGRFFASLDLKVPRVPLYSCASEGRMADDPDAVRRLAIDQWTRPVGFRRTVEAMRADGLDVFVDVGARGNLAGFVEDTLRGRPAFAIAANLPRRSGLTQLNHLVASLFARGVDLEPDHLYARRRPLKVDFAVPRKSRTVPSLEVGFPSMKLSDGLIERLRGRRVPTKGKAKSNGDLHSTNGHHGPNDDISRLVMDNGVVADLPSSPMSRPDFSRARIAEKGTVSGPTEVGPTHPLMAIPGRPTIHQGPTNPPTMTSRDLDPSGSLPSCGGGPGWGVPQDRRSLELARSDVEGPATSPHPNPPPRGGGASRTTQASGDGFLNGQAGVDATLLDFQETMNSFLRTQQAVMAAFLATGAPEPEFSFPHSRNGDLAPTRFEAGPWAGVLVSMVDGWEAVSILTLDAKDDPVAEHHTLGGRRISSLHPGWRGLPVLPFSVMAEMLAEAAARLVPGKPLVGLRDVRAHKWIRFEDEPVALEIRARLDPGRPDSVAVSIHNRGPARALRPVEAAVFEGVAVFGDRRPEGTIAGPFSLENPDVSRFTAGSIYDEQWLFHGPALQAVEEIGAISMEGVEGTLRVLPLGPLLRAGVDPAGVLTDPILLDNFTHLLGAWGLDRLADDGDVIFPLGMDELAIHGDRPPEGSSVTCRIAIRELERHRVRVDADLVGPGGRVWMTIRGWEDWRFHWPGRYRDGFRQPDLALLGEPLDLPGQDHRRAQAVWLEPPGDMGRPVWRDVLEHVQMGPDERDEYLAMPGPDHRRTHRLWGRIAAKEAARRLWLGLGHPPVYPADLIVEYDPGGRPRLRSRWEPGRDDLPGVSIAHVDGVAVALACLDPTCPIGIDVEPIVERSGEFEATAFSFDERRLLGEHADRDRDEWIARAWCAREAVAKATGRGFDDGPPGAEVVAMGPDGSMGVRLRGGLAVACPGLARGLIRVDTARRGDHAWAWTLGAGRES